MKRVRQKPRGLELKSELYVRTPGSLRLFTKCVIFMMAILIGAMFLPWQQTSFGTGRVIAYAPDDRIQVVQSPVEGRIANWYVVEGSFVKKGQPLADILDIDPNIMDRLRRELEAAEQKVSASEKGLEFSRKNLERQRDLAKKGLSSQRAYELAELEVAKLVSDLSSARSEFARIQVRVSRQASQIVSAPRDGVIQRILATQGGAVVQPGTTIALLVPDTASRAAEITIDGNDIPLMQIGRNVRLQFEGWPAIQFVGWPSVAVGTFGGKVIVIDPTDDGTGKFRVIIEPDSNDAPWPSKELLRQGIRAQAWVLLDQVTIGYEIWRRLNGFPVSLQNPNFLSDYNKPKGRKEKKGEKTDEK